MAGSEGAVPCAATEVGWSRHGARLACWGGSMKPSCTSLCGMWVTHCHCDRADSTASDTKKVTCR